MALTAIENHAEQHDALQVPQVRRLRSSRSLQQLASTYKKVRDSNPLHLSTGLRDRVSAIRTTLSAKSSSSSPNLVSTTSTSIPQTTTDECSLDEAARDIETFLEESETTPIPASTATPPRPSWSSLPAEIREQIYTYAFTGKTIHIHREWLLDSEPSDLADMAIFQDDNGQPYGVGYTLCVTEQTDSEAHAKTKLPDESEHDVFVAHWQDRHIKCRRTNPHRQTELPVSFFRACRQIYFEAAHILYSSNTFCFQSSTDMDFFVRKVLPGRIKKDLRDVRLHAEHVFCSAPFEGLQQTTVDMLAGLRFLGLTVGYYKTTGHKPTLPVFADTLKTVEMVIGPKKPNVTLNTAFRNREMAEQMESQLMSTKRTEPLPQIHYESHNLEQVRATAKVAIGSGVPFPTMAAIRRNERLVD